MADRTGWGARESSAGVLLEKFEVLLAAWQSMLRRGVLTGTKEDKTLKQSWAGRRTCILKIAESFARDERCARHFFPLPLCARLQARPANNRAVS